jgi:hypothetical protein
MLVYRGYSTPPTSGTRDRIDAILGGKNLAWSDAGSQERMVKSCCAVGCTNRSTKGNTVPFYRFPADTERRRLWISAINRKGWEPNEYSYVCSAHFVACTTYTRIYTSPIRQYTSLRHKESYPLCLKVGEVECLTSISLKTAACLAIFNQATKF